MKFKHAPLGAAVCAAAALLSLCAQAQNIPRPPIVDSTHTYRIWGEPDRKEKCPSGQVLSGENCVALPTATSGATLLPYNLLSERTYTNKASFPLSVVAMPDEACYELQIVVDDQVAANTRDDCESSRTSVQAIVPAGSTFYIHSSDGGIIKRSSGKVTALANGAKWQDTGVYWTWTEIVDRKYVSPVPGFYCTSHAFIPGIYDYYLKNFDNYTGYVKRTGPFRGTFLTGDSCPFDGA